MYLISRHLSVMLIGQKNTSSHVSFLTYPPKYQNIYFEVLANKDKNISLYAQKLIAKEY